jgi:membrane protein DedA with SNARE-associated domain
MFQHPSHELIQTLSLWGYPFMLLLMILEGPIVTIVSAFLSSLGYFNIFIVFGLSITGDVIGDVILYSIGYFGGQKILSRVEKFLKISQATAEKLKQKFHENSGGVIFYVKSTTGLSYITFITAGTLRMKFPKFVTFSILGGVVWSLFLVMMGYFFGYAADKISKYIEYTGLVIFFAVVLFFTGIILYKRKRAKDILK